MTTLELLTLVGLPIFAAVCLGLLVRSLVEAHGGLWAAWLVLLVASIASWGYALVEAGP